MTQTATYGKVSEQAVSHYLHRHGYTVCDTNYTKRVGEIDVIARNRDTYVFVEVKARKNPQFAITTTITPQKQKKLIRTAQAYIHENKLSQYTFRFDVAIVSGDANVSYIEHAFTPEDTIL